MHKDRYFIVRRNCGFVGDIYICFQCETQKAVDEYMRKHSNCELIFASSSLDECSAELEKLRKIGINVY